MSNDRMIKNILLWFAILIFGMPILMISTVGLYFLCEACFDQSIVTLVGGIFFYTWIAFGCTWLDIKYHEKLSSAFMQI